MKKLFINGVFHLMTEPDYTARAILTENGKIVELFHNGSPDLADCELIDLQGNHVYPGFIDTHTHSFEGGLYAQSLSLDTITSIPDLLEKLDDYYQTKKREGTTQLDAFRFDENRIAEKRFPTRAELNSVCPDIPLVLRRIDGHSSVVNSAAWKEFVTANSDIFNASFYVNNNGSSRKDQDGEILRGDLNDRLVHWYHNNCSESDVYKAYEKAAEVAAANGITTVHTMIGDSKNSLMHYSFIKDQLSIFDIEFILYPQSFNLQAALDSGAERIGGCILADGSLGSYTAALRQPYYNQPYNYGRLYQTDEFWQDFIEKAHRHNLQVAVHCIGDAAVKQINDVYLKLAECDYRDLRHQLIHCELTPQDLLEEIVKSHTIPVMQPAFDMYWGGAEGYYCKVLGKSRYLAMNRFRSFLDFGVQIAGGSDWYITELDALQGIAAASNHHNSEERISVWEALRLYTVNAARLSHDENRLGRIEVGFDADFAVLDRNIISTGPCEKAKVIFTYKKAKLVYAG